MVKAAVFGRLAELAEGPDRSRFAALARNYAQLSDEVAAFERATGSGPEEVMLRAFPKARRHGADCDK